MNLRDFFLTLVPNPGRKDEITSNNLNLLEIELKTEEPPQEKDYITPSEISVADVLLPVEELNFEEINLIDKGYKSKWKGSEIDEAIEDSNHHINLESQDNPHNILPKLSQVITKSISDWIQVGEKFQTTIIIPNFNEELVIYINYAAETKEYAVKSGIGNNEVLINEDGVITLQADKIPLGDIKIVLAWQFFINQDIE